MAGFEVIVRPVIVPGIRPPPARLLPAEDDPDKGICVITGTGSHPVSLSHSTSISWSQTKPTETSRRVDEARIYQEDDDGTINEDNFIDIQVANKIEMKGAEPTSNKTPFYYEPVKEKSNVEILERDKIIKSGDK